MIRNPLVGHRSRVVLAASAGLAALTLSACGSSGSTTSGHDMSSMSPSAASSAGTSSSTGSSSASSSTSSSASSSASSSSAQNASAQPTIHIKGFQYDTPASVSPGATVTVMNMDSVAHTVTADAGSAFDVNVAGGKTGTFTAPSAPGSYDFHCLYHSNMHGVLVVK